MTWIFATLGDSKVSVQYKIYFNCMRPVCVDETVVRARTTSDSSNSQEILLYKPEALLSSVSILQNSLLSRTPGLLFGQA